VSKGTEERVVEGENQKRLVLSCGGESGKQNRTNWAAASSLSCGSRCWKFQGVATWGGEWRVVTLARKGDAIRRSKKNSALEFCSNAERNFSQDRGYDKDGENL